MRRSLPYTVIPSAKISWSFDPTLPALCRFDVRFEHETVTVEAFGLEIGDDVGNLPAGCRPVAIDDHEAIDVAPAVGLPASDASKDDDPTEIVDIVGVGNRCLDAVDECSDRRVELRLRNRQDRVVLLEAVRVDRDVVALGRLSNPDRADTVEELNRPPDCRASHTRSVDEFGDRELRVVGVGEQAEDVVRGTDTKDIGVRVGIRIDTDRFAISVTV